MQEIKHEHCDHHDVKKTKVIKSHMQSIRDGSSNILTFDYLGKNEQDAKDQHTDSRGFVLFDIQLKHESNLDKIQRLIELNR